MFLFSCCLRTQGKRERERDGERMADDLLIFSLMMGAGVESLFEFILICCFGSQERKLLCKMFKCLLFTKARPAFLEVTMNAMFDSTFFFTTFYAVFFAKVTRQV